MAVSRTGAGHTHSVLLEEIARVFHASGTWPIWQFIDRFLDRADLVGPEVMESVPDHLVQHPRTLHPGSEIRLTIAGLAATGAGQADVSLFLDVLSWCVGRERATPLGPPDEPEPLMVTSAEYRAHCEDRGSPVDTVTMAKAYQLLSVEGLTGSGGSNLSAGEWSTAVDERVRPFRRVTNLDEYQAVQAEIHGLDPVSAMIGSSVLQPGGAKMEVRDSARVFVVHGRNAPARDAVFEFLRALGLRPIEWSQAVRLTRKGSPYIGEILDAAFAEAQAVVILMTPDEIAYLRSHYAGDADPEAEPAAQARPNVLFEAGMAMGRDSARAILVELGHVRPFSDVAGRHMVRLDNSPERRKELAERLLSAGCAVDTTGEDWLKAGDLTPPPPPGNGLPLGKRLPANTSKSRIRLDLRYHDRPRGGRLEIINMGTEAVYDVDLEFPADVDHFHLVTSDLPLAKLPPGKSAKIIAVKTMGRGRDHFEVRVLGRTADGEPVSEEVFLSLLD